MSEKQQQEIKPDFNLAEFFKNREIMCQISTHFFYLIFETSLIKLVSRTGPRNQYLYLHKKKQG